MINNNIPGISSEKLIILQNIEKKIKTLSPEMAIPYIMRANSELAARNMAFTPNEINILFDVLTKDMSPSDKQRVTTIRDMLNSPN